MLNLYHFDDEIDEMDLHYPLLLQRVMVCQSRCTFQMWPTKVYFTELAYDLKHKHPQKDFALVSQTWGCFAS